MRAHRYLLDLKSDDFNDVTLKFHYRLGDRTQWRPPIIIEDHGDHVIACGLKTYLRQLWYPCLHGNGGQHAFSTFPEMEPKCLRN